MVSWRARRQLIAAGVAALIVGVVLFRVTFRFIPASTCFDSRQNQGELGIDCGGPCAPCELRNPQAVRILWARAVPVRAATYAVVAQIENPNEVLSSNDVEYEFTLFDGIGEIARKTGKTFLLAQERAPVIETNIETNRVPTRVEFRIPHVTWQDTQTDRPNVIVEKRDYQLAGEGAQAHSEVSADIANRSAFGLRNVEADILVYDENGNLIGANQIAIENLAAGARQAIKSIWPGELRGSQKTVEVTLRVNVFNPFIFLRP